MDGEKMDKVKKNVKNLYFFLKLYFYMMKIYMVWENLWKMFLRQVLLALAKQCILIG